MAKITIQLDDDVKVEAQKIFTDLGLSFSSAVDIYLRAVIREDGIPFLITRKSTKERYDYALVSLPYTSNELE